MKRLLVPVAAAIAALACAMVATASTTVGNFVNFSLGETAGASCPGGSDCTNIASEPAIRADGAGRFFGSSENGLGGGTVAFRSTDGGLRYKTLASPNQVSSANDTGFAPAGGDTDLAVAPDRNVLGYYNVYVASLSLA